MAVKKKRSTSKKKKSAKKGKAVPTNTALYVSLMFILQHMLMPGWLELIKNVAVDTGQHNGS